MNMVLAPQLITARCSGVLSLTISANVNNLNLFVLSGSPTEAVNIELTIDAAVVVGSTTTTSAALTTGALPLGSTVMIINMGRIQGAGGNGGAGSGVNNHGTPGSPGGSGGTALELFAQTSIQNANGEIYGGGGGGGGASSIFDGGPMAFYHGGGGGGGAGAPPGSGGAGVDAYISSTSGNSGTTQAGGAAGSPRGGPGGGPGTVGSNSDGASGGAAGAAIVTNGNPLTWLAGSTAPNVIGATT